MAKRKGNGGFLPPIYKSYVFRDKEPVIDELRTLIEDHFGERLSGKSMRRINESGGPSAACMQSWFFGTTKRPQNATIEAAGRAMGYRRKWIRN
jgi:hypothetical protein